VIFPALNVERDVANRAMDILEACAESWQRPAGTSVRLSLISSKRVKDDILWVRYRTS